MNELHIDKTHWKKYRFDEVCRQVNEATKDPQAEGLDHVIGLEHIEPNNLHITQWDTLEKETTFTRKFRKGQVLFGRRRAYQRKVAYAEFDGICSGDILVFEAIEEVLLPELLPFLIQSEGFFQKALATSAGSLSPRTKFKELADYEFLLPPKAEQKRLAELLWTADEVVEKEKREWQALKVFKNRQMSYLLNGQQHIQNTGKLDDWERLTISDLGIVSTSSVDKKQRPGEKNVSLINYMDVYTSKSKKITSDIEFMQVTAPDKQIDNNQVNIGDILFTPSSETKDDIGHSAVVYENLPNTLYSYHLVRLQFNREIDLDFKRYLFNNPSTLAYFTKRAQGITRMTLSLDDFNETPVLLPPLSEQKQIALKLSSIDSAIERIEKSILFSQQIKQELIDKIL